MTYAEQRETMYKGFARYLEEQRGAGKLDDLPLPVATPRLIADPPSLAFTPMPNRASRRMTRTVRRFKFPAFEKTWSAT